MNLLLVFVLLLAVRLASVFIVRTFYVPDEYWQSLEVAHKQAFGYGYLTWEWIRGIRSYIYPLLIAGVYKLLAYLSMDTVQALVLLPRILQATFTAFSDYRFFIWMGKKKWSLFLIIVQWFWFYIGSRTLSNTLEASLTTIALSYFPWNSGEGSSYVWPASLCCYIRPTAAVIWLPMMTYHLQKTRLSTLELIAKQFLPIGLLVGALCAGIDSYQHGKLIFTPYEFFKYNLVENIGSFYGSHPWHWYFTVGLPTVLGINTLPLIFGVVETIRHHKSYPIRKQLLITLVFALSALSVIEHKEFRFVASLLPLCLYISADTLTRWSYKAPTSLVWFMAIIVLVGNAVPAWYLSTVHQKGPVEVMRYLQEVATNFRDDNNKTASILFLMPCHSTPYYSHIHANVSMRFLTCEPNFKHKLNYTDEADKFYESPEKWLRGHIPAHPPTALPSHVVVFEPLLVKIHGFLENYKIVNRISNTEHIQPRTGKNIVVCQRLSASEENMFSDPEYKDVDKDKDTVVGVPGSASKSLHSAPAEDSIFEQSERNMFN